MALWTLAFIVFGSDLTFGKSYHKSIIENAICTLTIDRVIVGECEYGLRTGNQSKVIVVVFLSWSMPVAGEKIQVRLNGMTKLFDPFMKGCPPFVQFILDPDGGNYSVDASFITGNCAANPVNIILPLPCNPPVCSGPMAIGGKLYSDFNNNGLQESSENGLRGIEVRLYDDAKKLHAVTTTKTNGLWAIDNLVAGQKLRVEYQIPAGLFDAIPGPENKTRTQFATVGTCNVDLGIYQLTKVIDPNPWMVTTCFAKGDALNPASPAHTEPTLVANLYSTTEGGPRTGPNGNYYIANAGETGSVWGLSFQKETRQLFSGSFLKRNASLGPGGLGAIYVTDLSGFLPNPQILPGYRYFGITKVMVNLDSFGIQTGDERLLIRNLPINPLDASHDSSAFDKIGKWGLGDLDVNDAGDTLFVVNLYNRSLIIIAIGNPLRLPITADRVREIPIPDPGCSIASDWRPWGLKYKDGSLYVGGVCSAESTGNWDDLRAVVYSYTNGNFKQEVSFELNYTKGFLDGNICSTFRPWNNDFYKFFIQGDVVCGPVPVLSDIEFDSEENMIVSLGDRYGYQTGGRDYGTNTKDNIRYITFAGGDNLKLFKLKNEYILEQNASSGFYTTQGKDNNQGVCGGEFYFQDGFYSHQESSLGALAVHPSYNTVLATLMDPANIWSNGWSQLDNSLGTKKVNYNIFTGELGTFGKAAGLGDIELLIGSSTPKGIGVSLGNFIWNDLDQDGIQDPGETPLMNIPVLLFNAKDSLIKQTNSDQNGVYYFRDLDPYTEYFIQLGADTNYINGELIFNKQSFSTSAFHTRLNFGNSENDSDASRSLPLPLIYKDKLAINYLSGKDGENDFSIDFGLLPCFQVKPDSIYYDLCITDSVKVGDRWFSASNPSGLVRFPNTRGFGCDSLVVVNTAIHLQTSYSLDTAICDGNSLNLHNQIFDKNKTNGIIFLQAANQFGCDSVIQVNLNILTKSESNLDTTTCVFGKVILHNQTFDANRSSGDIILPGANHRNCDSTIHVKLQFLPFTKATLDTTICPGSFILLHNKRFDESNLAGSIILNAANQWGCDSIIEVNVSLRPTSRSQLDSAICPGGFILLHNQRFDELNPSGRIVLSGANAVGCDSIIEVSVSLRTTSRSQLDSAICPGGFILLHNQRFDELNPSGRIVLSGANVVGCDSIIQVEIHIRPESAYRIDTSICPRGNVSIHQVVFNETNKSGRIILNGANQFGCDSILNINLRIRPEYHFKDTIES
ncbi:MAG: SdrD B-like domain-containing protein, partial [Saprospiraceae bacterium]